MSALLPDNPIELSSLELALKKCPDSALSLIGVYVGVGLAVDTHSLPQLSNENLFWDKFLFGLLIVDSTPSVSGNTLSFTAYSQFMLSLLTNAEHS